MKKRVLFRQGDAPVGVYVFARGTAMLTIRSAIGQVVLNSRLAPGSVLGMHAVIYPDRLVFSFTSRSDALIGSMRSRPHR
jgi:CRP-like cAMP-binding protein